MALRCAIQLGILIAIHRLGGAASLADLVTTLSLPPSKQPFLGRLLRLLAATGVLARNEAVDKTMIMKIAGPEEEQQREGCSSSGRVRLQQNHSSSQDLWITWLAILNISYENRSLRVVDLYKEKDLNVSDSCNFPRWNTSGELAPPFKVDPANNQNLILYDCTKTTPQRDTALVEMRCGNASNAFVRAGGRFNETSDYALQGCDATVVPVMSLSSSGKANASDYERLISGGFLLTWDLPPPLPAKLTMAKIAIMALFTRPPTTQ
ncbi:hypothetical protein ZWY2020_031670 [Hordeum vulgare]|nr:hypothetical protein ZWY2020_031670 [Hordeum vulgare]